MEPESIPARDMFHQLRRITRLIFYLGSFFFFLAAILQYMSGAGLNGSYLLGGVLMALAPAALSYLENRIDLD